MSTLFSVPTQFLVNVAGKPYAGMKVWFYATGTSELQAVYQDALISSQHPQPVVADDDGLLPPIYLNPNAAADYRAVFATSGGSLIKDIGGIPRKRIDITGWAPLSVKASPFLAKGDFTASDSDAIQEAINAAQTAGGGTVWVPSGVYGLDKSINMRSGVTLMMDGGATFRWLNDTSIDDNMLKFESISDAHIFGGVLDGNRTNVAGGTQYGLFISNSNNCSASDVRVKNTTGVGIHIFTCDGVVVHNCFSNGNVFHGLEFEQCRDCIATGCVLSNNDRNGIFIWEGESTLLAPLGAKGCILNGNTSSANAQYGCAIQGPNTEDITVNGNTFRNNGQYGMTIFDRVKGCSVNGNTFAYNGFHGLYMWRAQYNSITGNRFHNNSQASHGNFHELMLDGDLTAFSFRNCIFGNVFKIDGAAKAGYAIKENSVNDGPNLIRGNVCDTGAFGGIAALHESESPGVMTANSSLRMCHGNIGRIAQRHGRSTFNGTGSQTLFQIPHNLFPDEPRVVLVTPGSPDAAGNFSVAWNSTDILVTYLSAPTSGTGNVVLSWHASN